MAHQIPAIYKAALKRYEDTTGEKLNDPSITKLITVGDLTNAIDARNEEFTAFRNKRHKMFAVLSNLVRPVEAFANLTTGAGQMFPPVSLVFGAVLSLINSAKGVSEKYDAITELMETLKDFTVRLEVHSREQISESLNAKLADILATLIDIFALSRKEIKSGRVRSFVKIMSAGTNPKIGDAIAKLARLTASEDRLVGAETLAEVKQSGRTLDTVSTTVNSTHIAVTQISGDISQVSVDVSQLNEKFEAFMVASHESAADMKDAKGKSFQERIKAVLRPSVSALDWYDKINKTRVPGTGNWIREEAVFQSWINKERPFLWIAGNPGAGKSYIASNIISFLREQYPQGVHHTSNVSVAYFFFKDDQPNTRSFDQALRDMAYQISQNDPAYEKYITSTCDSAQDIPSLHSIWRTLFTGYFLKPKALDSCVYLIFDGMDESYIDSRMQFLELTKDLQDTDDARIQIAMLGRPQLTEEFEVAAEIAKVPTIYITALNNSDDIVNYILNSIKKSTSLRRAPKSLQAEIVEKLSTGAQGMFIWVDFMLKELLKKRNEGAIRAVLNTAPRGLNEMIRHVLEGFSFSLKDNPEAAEDLNTLLAWVTCAERPLKLGELDTLLKVKSSTGDGNWWLEGTLRIQYASFFMLTREDGLATADLQRVKAPQDEFEADPSSEISTDGFEDVENDTDFDSDPLTTEVTFCHASIGDFFRNDSETHTVTAEDCPSIGLQYHDAKVMVLKDCLTVLCSGTTTELWKRAEKMLLYMRNYWIVALDAVDVARTSRDDRIFIGTSIVKLLSNEELVSSISGFPGKAHLSQANVELFTKWVTNSDVFNALSEKDQEWVLSTSDNRVELFLPCIKHVQKEWLCGLSWNAPGCANIVYTYISLCAGDSTWTTTSMEMNSEKIEKAAEWNNLEKNALWHRRLAMALREHKEYDAAIPHFQKALELDPSMWLARAGKAMCYLRTGTKEAYETAIELDRKNIQELEKIHSDGMTTDKEHMVALHLCFDRIANSLRQLGNADEALEAQKKAFNNRDRCDECIRAILEQYHATERYEDVLIFIRSLNEPIEGLDYTRLSESLMAGCNYCVDDDYFAIFNRAAYELDEIPFALEMYRNATTAARKQHKPVQAAYLELCLADICYRHGHDPERAVRIWERVVDTYRSIKADSEIADAKRSASISLARHCLKRSVEVERDTDEVKRCGIILERLGKVKVGSETTFAASEAATMLGSWYKLMGRAEEAHACFRVQVKEGIRMLSDDDPTNDSDAYWNLFSVLIAAEDDKTANGVFWPSHSELDHDEEGPKSKDHVMETGNPVEQTTEEKAGSLEAKDNQTSDWQEVGVHGWTCDGCLKPLLHNSVAVCRYCWDVAFCRDCFPLCRAGQLRVNICSPKHSWCIMEPKSKEECQASESSKLRIDGENVTVDELKRRLAAQWDI